MLWRSIKNMGNKHLISKTWGYRGVFLNGMVIVAAF
jgi:hypothetical protein